MGNNLGYTRSDLSGIIFIALIMIITYGLYFGLNGNIKQEGVFSVILSGLIGICGGIIGYYFAQNSK